MHKSTTAVHARTHTTIKVYDVDHYAMQNEINGDNGSKEAEANHVDIFLIL